MAIKLLSLWRSQCDPILGCKVYTVQPFKIFFFEIEIFTESLPSHLNQKTTRCFYPIKILHRLYRLWTIQYGPKINQIICKRTIYIRYIWIRYLLRYVLSRFKPFPIFTIPTWCRLQMIVKVEPLVLSSLFHFY